MPRIHIGFDARFAGVTQGGIGRYVEQVVRAFVRLEHDLSVTLFLRKENWGLFDNLDNRFKRTCADVPWYGVREQTLLPGIFARAACDLYHVPHFNMPLCMPRPFVLTLHDLIMWERGDERDTIHGALMAQLKQQTMKAVVKQALKHCVACVVPSRWSAERIGPVTGMKPKRVEVIYEGADALKHSMDQRNRPSVPSLLRRGWGGFLHEPYILTVGNAYRHKNIFLVIDAVSSLRDKFSNIHHVHAGPLHPRVFYDALVKYGKEKLGERFHHIGNVTDAELVALYQHATVLVAASDMEGFALPALEAMYEGCPVVASRTSCFPEVLGDAARYFEPGMIQGLAGAIEQLLTDQQTRVRFARLGKVQAEKYTWRKHAEALVKVYISAIGRMSTAREK